MTILLSIIIPAHNEQERIANTLFKITKAFYEARKLVEVIVVANGCTDETEQVVRDFICLVSDRVVLVKLPQRGKGLAVRTGMLMANGMYRYLCDADLSTPISAAGVFLREAHNADVVIGSRELAFSKVHTTLKRRLIGRAFSTMTGLLVPGIPDTQCGFKLFSAAAANNLFKQSQINGMAFDVEILFLARQAGYTIKQIPVEWTHNPDSRVRLIRDSARMALDLLRIRRRTGVRMPQAKIKLPA